MRKAFPWLLGLCALLGLAFLNQTACTTYKFGIREASYPDHFPPRSNLNGGWKHNAEYSWQTDVPVRGGTVSFEHLVVADDEDKQHLNLPAGEYLWFSIDIQAPDAVRAIEVTHSYRGSPLRVFGTYLFMEEAGPDGNPDPNTRWVITPVSGSALKPRKHRYGFVRVYEAPVDAQIAPLVPKRFWFDSGVTESIRIEAESSGTRETHQFDFALDWHESSTVLYRIVTIT